MVRNRTFIYTMENLQLTINYMGSATLKTARKLIKCTLHYLYNVLYAFKASTYFEKVGRWDDLHHKKLFRKA